MDTTDQQLAEQMLRMHEANLDDLRQTADTPYADFAFVLDRIAYWSDKLYAATFAGIAACRR